MKQLIKITTIYGEECIRVLVKRTKDGIYTEKGFIYFYNIKYIEIIGEMEEIEILRKENKELKKK